MTLLSRPLASGAVACCGVITRRLLFAAAVRLGRYATATADTEAPSTLRPTGSPAHRYGGVVDAPARLGARRKRKETVHARLIRARLRIFRHYEG